MHLSFMPAVGIGMALCSQVGHAIGRGRPEHARIKAWVAMRLTGAYMGTVGLLMFAGGGLLIDLFTDDPQVIQTGRMIMVWVAIFQVFDAMTITYMNALRGAGDTRWPAIAVAFCCWVIFIGGGYTVVTLAPQWGVNGPWLMFTTYVIVLGLALLLRWRGGSWQNIRLFDDSQRAGASSGNEPASAEADGLLADAPPATVAD
jgi:MATE family multidrug resistance protein